MWQLLTLVCLSLGLQCGVLIIRHVSIVCTCVSIAWTSVRGADYTACVRYLHLCVYPLDFCAGCGLYGMLRLLALVCLSLGPLCGVLIIRHVSIACTCLSIAWTSVRGADYTACVRCLDLCVYCLDFCVSIAWASVRDADYTACGGCLHLCIYCLYFCRGC